MHDNPFLVLGTGRSGTSVVARILHTKLNVFMGSDLSPPDKSNPLGGYEDYSFSKPNKSLVAGNITLRYWAKLINQAIQERMAMDRPWGFKDPTVCHILGWYLAAFENPCIIRCIRKLEDSIASCQKWYGWDKDRASDFIFSRATALDRLLVGRDVQEFDFTEYVVEEEIERALREKWGEYLEA